MSFCPTCGRQRDTSSRFCTGCGHEFRESAPADATRWDVPLDVTRLEPAAGGSPRPEAGNPGNPGKAADPGKPADPDPFAAWFAPGVPARPADQPVPPRTDPASQWQTADTVYAAPAQAPAYWPPAGPPAPGAPPPGPVYGEPSRRPSSGAKAVLIIAVVLVVLGAGGGAYAFISRSGKTTASPPSTATTSAAATAAASANPGTSAAGSPSASRPAAAKPSASPSPSLVSVASGVGSNPATPQVETVLSHFFAGINTHSYQEYTSALDAQQRARQTRSSFDKGYSTTTDSGMTLTSLTSTGSGGLAATVTFTSHQAASSSVDNSTCNNWTLTFYLVPDGAGYLDGSAPSGYQPTYSDC